MYQATIGEVSIDILIGIVFLAVSSVWIKRLSQVPPNVMSELGDQRAEVLNLMMKWAKYWLVGSIGYLVFALLLLITKNEKVRLLLLVGPIFLILGLHAMIKATTLLKSKEITLKEFRRNVPRAAGIYRIFIPGASLIIALFILRIAWYSLWLPGIVYKLYPAPKYELNHVKQEFDSQWKAVNIKDYDSTNSSEVIYKLEKYERIFDNAIASINNIKGLDISTRRAYVNPLLLQRERLENMERRLEEIESEIRNTEIYQNRLEELPGMNVELINPHKNRIEELKSRLEKMKKDIIMGLDKLQNPFNELVEKSQTRR